MSLLSLNPTYISGSYSEDRNLKIKEKENTNLLNNRPGGDKIHDADGPAEAVTSDLARGTSIGYGWDIDVHTAAETLAVLGAENVVLTGAQIMVLVCYKERISGTFTVSGVQVTRVPTQQDLFNVWDTVRISRDQATSLLNSVVQAWETGLTNALGTTVLSESRERAALVSLLYNMTDSSAASISSGIPNTLTLLGAEETTIEGQLQQRFNIWYEIAFGSNLIRTDPLNPAGPPLNNDVLHGLQIRRLDEAEMFSMFQTAGQPDHTDNGLEAIRAIQFLDSKNTNNGLLNYLTERNYNLTSPNEASNKLAQIYAPSREHLIDEFYNKESQTSGVLNNVTVTVDQSSQSSIINAPDMNNVRDLIMGEDEADVINSGGGEDVVYGGESSDQLSTGDGNDILFGGQGNDFLIGGKDNDLLIGGSNIDTYVFDGADFGHDIISDTGGRLLIDGTIVGEDGQSQGGKAKIVDNHDGSFTLTHLGESYWVHLDSSSHELLIQKGSDSITIKDFNDGTFGLALTDANLVDVALMYNVNINVLANSVLTVSVSNNARSFLYLPDTSGSYSKFSDVPLDIFLPISTSTSDGNLAVYSSSSEAGIFEIQMYDSSGNLLYTKDLTSEIDFSGNYFYPRFLLPDENGGVALVGSKYNLDSPESGGTGLLKFDRNFNLTSPMVIAQPHPHDYGYVRFVDWNIYKIDQTSYYQIDRTFDYQDYSLTNSFFSQQYDFSGAAVGNPLRLGEFTFYTYNNTGVPAVLYVKDLDANSKLLSWHYINVNGGFDNTFQFQILYSDGSRSGVFSQEVRDTIYGVDDPVTVLDNGAFVVTIRDAVTKNYLTQAYDNNGNRIGAPLTFETTKIVQGVVLGASLFDTVVIPNVGYAAAWIGGTYAADEYPIYAKKISVDTVSTAHSPRPQHITGSSGDDLLIAGMGDNLVEGGDGYDTYVYRLGDGVDSVVDQGSNRLQFPDIALNQISLGIGSLVLKIEGSAGEIHLLNFDVNNPDAGAGISEFKFSDGITYTLAQILDIGFKLPGSSGNDSLQGTNSKDIITGLAGNDTLVGNGGNDVLEGGIGDDSLSGGTGNDQYLFNEMEGSDAIQDIEGAEDLIVFGSSITPVRVKVFKDTAHHQILINILQPSNTTVQSTIAVALDTLTEQSVVENLKFSDGTIWVVESVAVPLTAQIAVTGTAANDSLVGSAADDIINGLAGHDTLLGNDGNDVLVGGTGNDTMAGGAGDDVFLIEGTDQGADRIQGDDGNDEVRGGAGDDLFSFSAYTGIYTVEKIDGKDGTNRIAGTAADNSLNFSNTDLVNIVSIDGGAGHDTVTGTAAADVIIGGPGNDIMAGGAGDDVFVVEGTDQGADRVQGDDGSDEVRGGAGDDLFSFSTYTGVYTVEKIDGKGGVNRIVGTAADNTLNFGATELVNIVSIEGGAGHDNITGSALSDLIVGGTGNDVITGGAGDDIFLVEGLDQGADRVQGDEGADEIRGGAGNDLFSFSTYTGVYTVEKIDGKGGSNSIAGTAADNTLNFSSTELVSIVSIEGGAGHDTITGTTLADVIIGGTGNDVMTGGAGDDVFLVEGTDQGADRVEGDDGADEVQGGSGDDWFGFSTYTGVYVVEKIDGKAGVNKIVGTSADNTLNFAATDLVNIASIEGGAGHDSITGSAIADTIVGGTGNDVMAGGAGNDVFMVEGVDQGADRVEGDDGNDEVRGGAGDDLFSFSTYTGVYTVEKIDGKGGTNRIAGTAADNTLDFSGTQLVAITSIEGGAGHDQIKGSSAADVIMGGTGNDVLTGGAGTDTFVFNTALVSNVDQITDFNAAEDKLSLDHAIFTKLTTLGALSTDSFIAGAGITAAADADDYLIYNATNGNLYYDSDGSGTSATAILIGTLQGAPTLASSNILVI